MTLTNPKDGIRMTSKMPPCAAAVCYFATQSAAEPQRPWKCGLGQAVASRVASVRQHLTPLVRAEFSVLSLEMFAQTTGHASTHILKEDIKN